MEHRPVTLHLALLHPDIPRYPGKTLPAKPQRTQAWLASSNVLNNGGLFESIPHTPETLHRKDGLSGETIEKYVPPSQNGGPLDDSCVNSPFRGSGGGGQGDPGGPGAEQEARAD